MERVRKLLTKVIPGIPFSEGCDFVRDGHLDSLEVIRLTTELESEFQIQIDGSQILPENFKDLNALANLVRTAGGKIQ